MSNEKYTYPPPRCPTPGEVREMVEANKAHFGDDYEASYVAVWDHYISDCPGYTGWVALAFGGVPDYVTGYCRTREGVVEVCSFGDDQGFLRSQSCPQ